MKKLAFVSRHEPTEGQNKLARQRGYELCHVGDRDAFVGVLPGPGEGYDGVVVVHAAAAMRSLYATFTGNWVVGVYENANRAPVGEKPTFEAVRLHLFTLTSDCPEVSGVRQVPWDLDLDA